MHCESLRAENDDDNYLHISNGVVVLNRMYYIDFWKCLEWKGNNFYKIFEIFNPKIDPKI